jgi:hypothetical protein
MRDVAAKRAIFTLSMWMGAGRPPTMKPPEKLYRFHVENLRSIQAGLEAVLDSARLAIARREPSLIDTHVRLYAFLMGAWAECRLLKLLYEPNAFDDSERRAILAETALDRWVRAVEIAFRRHYKVKSAPLTPPALPATAFYRFNALNDLLNVDLQSVIVLRNKLAHGQWAYPLNEQLDDVAQSQMDALRDENILSLKQKSGLIEAFCDSIHDLVVSPPTFERDFDNHFRRVAQLRANLLHKSYERWCMQIQHRYDRGRDARAALRKDA